MRKIIKKQKLAAVLLSIGLAAALSGCRAEAAKDSGTAAEASASQETVSDTAPDTEVASELEETKNAEPLPSKKDDYFEAVNGALLSDWEIAADESYVSQISKMQDRTNEQMASVLQTAAKNEASEKGSDENNIRALYLTGMDQEGRNAGGYGQLLTEYFESIDSAESINELMRVCLRFDRDYGLYSIAGLTYGTDMADSSQKILFLASGDPGLPKEIWFSEDPANQSIVQYFHEFLKDLCIAGGYSEEKADEAVEQTAAIMKTLAENSLSLEDSNNPEAIYNLYTIEELESLLAGAATPDMLREIFSVEPEDPVIVTDVNLVKALASLLTEENLPALKEYVKLCTRKDTAVYTDMASYEAAMDYNRKASGLEESQPFEEVLAETVQSSLGFQCGRLYCEQYFPEETIADVSAITRKVIETFDSRISNLDWMSEETKTAAKNKLANLTVRIGHPTQWPQDLYDLVLSAPEEGGLYIDNILAILKANSDYTFATSKDPVDKTQWPNTPQTINAYYSPQDNSINILAGILQAPFYDPNASVEENLGGIGTVIGHEITHAFDTTGAQFDEAGNLRDWWTAKDKEYFQTLADETAAYYDAMEIDGKQVNGSMTVSENIADLGGVACVTQIAQENGYDLEAVYEAYANIWAFKGREEYLAMQIATDVHSPEKIRVNAVLSAQQAFRDLYGIEEGDGMYQEMMPKIW